MILNLFKFLANDVYSGKFAPVDEPASEVSPLQIAAALRAGICPTNDAFDRYLPDDLRFVSSQYWTPLVVAVRAARWLDELNVRTVVDIGSGAGKFCVAGALSGNCHFTGLEQRARLVSAAAALARLFEVEDRVQFVKGALGESAAPIADAYYLYNPFGENLLGPSDHLDEDVEISDERFVRDVAAVEDLLRDAAVGTYVLTYNGFGGKVPAGYTDVRVDR